MQASPTKPELLRLRAALHSDRYTSGGTHNFYLYPARFSPEIARAVIETFSSPGDWVLDPFMGGGTAVIEGLSLGRSMIGVDLNALAHFVARVRTTPLSGNDETVVHQWAARVATRGATSGATGVVNVRLPNLPPTMKSFLAHALLESRALGLPRQRAFAQCVLLRLGQWALDCRDSTSFRRLRLEAKLLELTEEMLHGMRDFVGQCRSAGLAKNEIVGSRLLICNDAAEIHENSWVKTCKARARLVFTSPPYPGVHVLYHRWQVRGRRETPAPYWVAEVSDGYYASHYTGGSRTPTGERRYFAMIRSAFSSIRHVLAQDALVVQLVGFADVKRQLPGYLTAMDEAGFDIIRHPLGQRQQLWRSVPNRKWYAKLQGAVDASSELLLFHRPRRERRRS